jgi:hypothetical protein
VVGCFCSVNVIAKSNDQFWDVTGLLLDSRVSILFGRPGWAF